MPHVVVAPDKFKGSLTAAEVARHVAAGLRRAVPGLSVATLPVADGGEGTLDAVISAGFRRVPVRATGPTGTAAPLRRGSQGAATGRNRGSRLKLNVVRRKRAGQRTTHPNTSNECLSHSDKRFRICLSEPFSIMVAAVEQCMRDTAPLLGEIDRELFL